MDSKTDTHACPLKARLPQNLMTQLLTNAMIRLAFESKKSENKTCFTDLV